MYIEDLINILWMGSSPNLNRFDNNMLNSFVNQMFTGLAFTEKQSIVILRILKKQKTYLEQTIGQNLDQILDNPKWKSPFRTISTAKKMSLNQNDVYGTVIKVEFPYDENIIKKIHELKQTHNFAQWDKDKKAWIFPMSEQNLSHLMDLAQEYQFQYTDELAEFFNQIKKIKENIENYVPMLVWENNEPKLVNFSPNLVKIESKTILSAVFEARKYGFYVWDSFIDQYLNSDDILQTTREFLNCSPITTFNINPEKIPLSDLRQIVNHMFPMIFIIPGGSELEKLNLAYNFLQDIGVDNTDISVLFRLPSETHKDFNDFVKNEGLNNPTTETTKVIFLSSKLPKTVLKLNRKFNLIINLGYGSVHYTMRNFISKHENTINYAVKTDQETLNFDNL